MAVGTGPREEETISLAAATTTVGSEQVSFLEKVRDP